MARVKIVLPDTFAFNVEIPVRITNLNYAGHLANDQILGIMHEARMKFFEDLGCTELDAFGAGTIMADAAITYKNEGFYGDVLTIFIAPGDVSAHGFDLYYKIVKDVNSSPITIAHGKTYMVCYDYKARKMVKLPAILKEKITAICSPVVAQ